jgi:protein kinase A
MAQEFCPFGSIFEYMYRRRKSFSVPEILYIGRTLASALEFLHSKEIVYRDVKPENLLINRSGLVKLSDFGLAEKLEKERNFKTFTYCGSLYYMSPEVFARKEYSFQCDFYSFGILFYELLHGCTPFSGNPKTLAYEKSKDSFHFSFTKGLDETLKKLLIALCRFDPDKRLSDWKIVKEELRKVEGRLGTKAECLDIAVNEFLRRKNSLYKVPTSVELEYDVFLEENMDKFFDQETIKTLVYDSMIVENN